MNSVAPQGAATVSVSGVVDSGGAFHSPVAAVDMDSDPGEVLGVANGRSPLLAEEVFFDVRSAKQAFPFVDGSNTLSVTLAASHAVSPLSTITLNLNPRP